MQETHDIIVKKLSELSGEIDVPSDGQEVIAKKSLKDYAVKIIFLCMRHIKLENS